MTGRIFEIKRFAVHDGDGIRTTVFFKGCPLRCVWCHNPEGLSHEIEEAFYPHKCVGCGECKKDGFTIENCLGEARTVYGKDLTKEELIPILLEDEDFYRESGGGVTLSGGECLSQADFVSEVLKELKAKGINTAVDTSGYATRDALLKVIPYTDTFLYDIKAYSPEVHGRCTGVSNEIILDNLLYLNSIGADVEIRIPVVPGFNDGEIEDIARFLAPLKSVKKIRILPYHNYARSKYDALSISSLLPERLPTSEEIRMIEETVKGIIGK